MSNGSVNPFVSFYGEHNVSPVKQDISDLNSHIARRRKLYRALGLPPIAFSKSETLEVGPGGGHNAIVLFHWGAKIDFVEPNPTGQRELIDNMSKYKIDNKLWNLYKQLIEDYVTEKKYDIIIAEGFIPMLYNRNQIINKIISLITSGGVVVVTCVDEISLFFEHLKRLIATKLIRQRKIVSFDEKVRILAQAFGENLKTLLYATRSIEDWVIDTFLNPAMFGNLFGIDDCINEFGGDFEFLGSSPRLFTDYSWYKDLEIDEKQGIVDQYLTKRDLLLSVRLKDTVYSKEINKILFEYCKELRLFAKRDVDNGEFCEQKYILVLERISCLLDDKTQFEKLAIDEAIDLLRLSEISEENISKSKYLKSAFGRGTQYMSLVKK